MSTPTHECRRRRRGAADPDWSAVLPLIPPSRPSRTRNGREADPALASPGHTQRLLLFCEGLDGRIRTPGCVDDRPVKGAKKRTKERIMAGPFWGFPLAGFRGAWEGCEGGTSAGGLFCETLLVPGLLPKYGVLWRRNSSNLGGCTGLHFVLVCSGTRRVVANRPRSPRGPALNAHPGRH